MSGPNSGTRHDLIGIHDPYALARRCFAHFPKSTASPQDTNPIWWLLQRLPSGCAFGSPRSVMSGQVGWGE